MNNKIIFWKIVFSLGAIDCVSSGRQAGRPGSVSLLSARIKANPQNAECLPCMSSSLSSWLICHSFHQQLNRNQTKLHGRGVWMNQLHHQNQYHQRNLRLWPYLLEFCLSLIWTVNNWNDIEWRVDNVQTWDIHWNKIATMYGQRG